MKVSLNWINDFVNVKNVPLAEICKKLGQIGFEVEGVIEAGRGLERVVASQIISIKQHPNADKLVVCEVDAGGASKTQIVTGAKNMQEGDYIPLALNGASLPCGIEIKNSVIRGEASFGMFCGASEIGITNAVYPNAENDGLLIFNKTDKIKAGTPVKNVFGLDDTILDVNVTPNRPDVNSILGVARELAAILKLPLKMPDLSYSALKKTNPFSVEIKNFDACPRYMGTCVTNVKNGESPIWMKRRLAQLGHTPHSLFVDITNYVLCEIGQPMHAFDASKIFGNKIIIQNAAANEKIKLLSEKEVALTPEMLVILDAAKPLVIAGIMGGLESGTFKETKEVFLESAVFDYALVRRTSRKIGISSDSSLRFGKGVYFNSAELGMKRALNLIYALNAGEICENIIDIKKAAPAKHTVKSSIKNINERLALNISGADMVNILNSLEIKTTQNGDVLTSEVPDYRTDIELECDICEEVGRIYGYDNISAANNTKTSSVSVGHVLNEHKNIGAIKEALIGAGANEILTFQFISPSSVKKLEGAFEKLIPVLNPLGQDYSLMRDSLKYEMLNTLSSNLKKGNNNLFLFELARVFITDRMPLTALPKELQFLCAAMCGEQADFYELKDALNKAADTMGVKFEYKAPEKSAAYLHPGKSADVYLYNRRIGEIGELHPETAAAYEINKKVYIAEIDLSASGILTRNTTLKNGRAAPKLPLIERDIAVVANDEISAGAITAAVISAAKNELDSAEVFDVYKNSAIGENKKSVAIKIKIKQGENSLNDAAINDIISKVLKSLEKELNVKLRS